MHNEARTPKTVGLMLSGGIDSAVLLSQLLKQGSRVQPFYVNTGSAWDREERKAVSQLISVVDNQLVAPVVEFEMPVADLYGQHWSLSGQEVPDGTTEDAAVGLLGRNPLLLLKPMLWCSKNDIRDLALATLANNPFADAHPHFFQQFEQSLATATGNAVRIRCPYASKTKSSVLTISNGFPLEVTFSCLSPQEGLHCGACNKCAERSRALSSLPLGDLTSYATPIEVALN